MPPRQARTPTRRAARFTDLPADVVIDVVARHLGPRNAAALSSTARAYRPAAQSAATRAAAAVAKARRAREKHADRLASALYRSVAVLNILRQQGFVLGEYQYAKLAKEVTKGGGGMVIGLELWAFDAASGTATVYMDLRGQGMGALFELQFRWEGGVIKLVSVQDHEPTIGVEGHPTETMLHGAGKRIIAAYRRNPVRVS